MLEFEHMRAYGGFTNTEFWGTWSRDRNFGGQKFAKVDKFGKVYISITIDVNK